MNDTITRLTFHTDLEFPERFVRVIAITEENESDCEECDEPLNHGLALEVSLDSTFDHPVVIHMRHLDADNPDAIPHTAHLDI